jgi:peroxiredoxin-like protein
MQEFPHRYAVAAVARPEGDVRLDSDRLPTLSTAPPQEFGGPGDRWSPETMLVGAVADCFVLSFRAVAGASRFEWDSLACEAEGVLDRVDRVTRFTEFRVRATLSVPPGADEQLARRLLAKAEQVCLITNSLSGTVHLEAEVVVLKEA